MSFRASPRWAVALILIAAALAPGCKKRAAKPSGAGGNGKAPAAAATVTVLVAYGSEKKTWLEEQAQAFNASGAKTKSGRSIAITGKAMGSGEAMTGIVGGTLKPHVYSPASTVYVTLLNETWRQTHPKAIGPSGEPVVLSPIVIAMWRPMAEALGWPDKQLGWNDLLRVDAKKGWKAFGRPEWGRFKLGHTHPEYSSSGILAVLAEAYAGAGKTRDLTVADLDQAKTRALIAAVERTLVHYGKSTGFFADKMIARGPSFLSAAVLYENLVIESYAPGKNPPLPIVAIYPVEGTFWADHPYVILDAEWVGAEEREAAEQFQAFLKARPAQQRALALGFRPADPSIPITAPIDADHGVDAKQPQTLLDVPDAATLGKLLDLWREVKKTTDVIFVFDKSGSMAGKPLAEAKIGAKTFLQRLSDRDEVTLILFDNQVYEPIGPVTIGEGRAEMERRIDEVIAHGGTALYDVTAKAYEVALRRADKGGKIHAVVVMTDGKDESSGMTLQELTKRFPEGETPVKVFTITYGKNADPRILEQIAEAAGGASAKGNVESIVQVYEDMASFF